MPLLDVLGQALAQQGGKGEVPTTRFAGDFHLHDIYRSTDVTNGEKTVECSNTRDSTNYSKEVFTDEDSFTVELKVEKLCGGCVHLGFVPAQVEKLPTASHTCGKHELESSLACVIEPGKVRLLTRARWTLTGSCNTSDPTVMRFQFTKGKLSFSIDGAELSPTETRQYKVSGQYRLGVSLPVAGQRATLRVVSGDSEIESPTSFHLSGSHRSTKIGDCRQAIVEAPAPAETTPTPATPHTAAKAAPPSPQKPAPPSTATASSTAVPAPPVVQPTLTPPGLSAKVPAHLNPDSDPHAAENVAVTTPLRIPKNYAFDGDLGAELVKHEALLGLESCCMEDMVEDCMMVATCRVDRLRKQKGSSPLDEREALTMALYTHDVPEVDPHEQFYFVLNDIIHRRDAAKLRALLPFRFLFAAALEKLPVVAEPGGFVELYRGINGVDTDRIRAEYTVGVKVQWTPITSLSLARSVAAMFARDGGVLFIVTAVNARDVRDFSQKQDEQEVILRPDTRFIVTRTVQTSDCLEIYLTEESGAVVRR